MARPKLIKVDVVDARGLGGAKNKTVSVQTRIPDILAFRDTPGFAYLLLAANPDVPVPVLSSVLTAVNPRQSHPAKWLYERRQFFTVPTIPDYVDDDAIEFVHQHMNEPSWKIHKQMRAQNIKCSLQMVHRIWMTLHYDP